MCGGEVEDLQCCEVTDGKYLYFYLLFIMTVEVNTFSLVPVSSLVDNGSFFNNIE